MTTNVKNLSSTSAVERQLLDTDTARLANWLIGVCGRSDVAYDQVFIFRRPSTLSRLLRLKRLGEIKAVAMPDLMPASQAQYHLLRRLQLISPIRGRWPGKWFRVNRDAILRRPETSNA